MSSSFQYKLLGEIATTKYVSRVVLTSISFKVNIHVMSGESSAKYIKPLDVTHVMSVWGNQKGRKTLLGL